ncbi:MAG: LpxD N-terminal domain-containing protein, partial [Pyrinomonadaceae bacterium]
MSKSSSEKTVGELAALVGGLVVGDAGMLVRRIASIKGAGEGDVSFVEDEKFFEEARQSRASCLIVPKGVAIDGAACLIEAARPKLAFALIAGVLHPPKMRAAERHPSAIVAESAQVAAGVFVGAFVCIGENSVIGARTQLGTGAKVGDGVRVGEDCVIHPNV